MPVIEKLATLLVALNPQMPYDDSAGVVAEGKDEFYGR